MPARVSKFALTAALIGLGAALPNYGYGDEKPGVANYAPTGTYPEPTPYPGHPEDEYYNGPPVTYTDNVYHTHAVTMTTTVPCAPYTSDGMVYSYRIDQHVVYATDTETVTYTKGCDEHGCYGLSKPAPTPYVDHDNTHHDENSAGGDYHDDHHDDSYGKDDGHKDSYPTDKHDDSNAHTDDYEFDYSHDDTTYGDAYVSKDSYAKDHSDKDDYSPSVHVAKTYSFNHDGYYPVGSYPDWDAPAKSYPAGEYPEGYFGQHKGHSIKIYTKTGDYVPNQYPSAYKPDGDYPEGNFSGKDYTPGYHRIGYFQKGVFHPGYPKDYTGAGYYVNGIFHKGSYYVKGYFSKGVFTIGRPENYNGSGYYLNGVFHKGDYYTKGYYVKNVFHQGYPKGYSGPGYYLNGVFNKGERTHSSEGYYLQGVYHSGKYEPKASYAHGEYPEYFHGMGYHASSENYPEFYNGKGYYPGSKYPEFFDESAYPKGVYPQNNKGTRYYPVGKYMTKYIAYIKKMQTDTSAVYELAIPKIVHFRYTIKGSKETDTVDAKDSSYSTTSYPSASDSKDVDYPTSDSHDDSIYAAGKYDKDDSSYPHEEESDYVSSDNTGDKGYSVSDYDHGDDDSYDTTVYGDDKHSSADDVEYDHSADSDYDHSKTDYPATDAKDYVSPTGSKTKDVAYEPEYTTVPVCEDCPEVEEPCDDDKVDSKYPKKSADYSTKSTTY